MAHVSMLVLAFALIAQGNAASSIYKDLYKHITDATDGPNIPPVPEFGKPLVVGLQMGILGISNVDREHNTVDVDFLLHATWNSGVFWNPADYSGVKFFSMKRNTIWHPKLGIRNALKLEMFEDEQTSIMFSGLTGSATRCKATILCDLSQGDKCHIDVGSADYYNNVIAFEEPDKLFYKIKTLFDEVWLHKASPYPVVESKNVKQALSFAGIPQQADMIKLEFSFKDPHRHHRHHHFH